MSLARSINRAPFAPAEAGEKVPKADEGAAANYSVRTISICRTKRVAPMCSRNALMP